jgi:hypothetical protein
MNDWNEENRCHVQWNRKIGTKSFKYNNFKCINDNDEKFYLVTKAGREFTIPCILTYLSPNR